MTAGTRGGPDMTLAAAGRLRADGLDAALVAVRGKDAAWAFVVRAVDPDLVALSFDGTEAIAGTIWAGLDGPPLATLAGAWVDPAAALAALTLDAADADLAPGTYNVEATLSDAG